MAPRREIVLDFLNSVPLAAQRGEGEVTGIGDGLHAWYGRDFGEANRVLAGVPSGPTDLLPPSERVLPEGAAPPEQIWGLSGEGDGDHARGAVYRDVLSLMLSQRRPSYYLTQAEGRQALQVLTDRYLDLLEGEGGITGPLAHAARSTRVEIRPLPPPRPVVNFVERKGANSIRTRLLNVLDVPRLYDLDRLDLSVRATLDARAQRAATELLRSLPDPEAASARSVEVERLLGGGDPSLVTYSFVLHERTETGNLVRIQTDNLDAPFNLNESARLELGSTAKLRTLASYLTVVAELHDRFSTLAPDSLLAHALSRNDPLSGWVRAELLAEPELDLEGLLRRAMARSYSASPAERFVTGGGVQTFTNFDNTFDTGSLSVAEAFRQSVNLVFVRLMRDVVSYYVYRVPGSKAHMLEETDSPLRQEYLARFADLEGIQYLNQFIPKYRGKSRSEVLEALVGERGLSPQRLAWAYRTVAPNGTPEEFEYLLRTNQPESEFDEPAVADLFARADPAPHSLADLGYLASVHPLELWVARYVMENPNAQRSQIIGESAQARQEVYRWLFQTSRQGAQDQRIRFLLEVEAFTEIHAGWRRLGYPFDNIVPSLGSAIGSSGDRPAALSDLVGIIVTGGVRLPRYQVEELHFAQRTPFETRMVREGAAGERVMPAEVAAVLRDAMIDVIENGTGRRMSGALHGPDGSLLTVGGKTGTGDNRYRVFAPGGREVESRSVNRTSTLVFFIDDRYYGVITAYVPGEAADAFTFTSALPAQILREMAPILEGLMDSPPSRAAARPSEPLATRRPGGAGRRKASALRPWRASALVEGGLPRVVVRDVVNGGHLGNGLTDLPLDALPERHPGHGAPLAAARHDHVDLGTLHVHQVDLAPVRGDRRIHLLLEDRLHAVRDGPARLLRHERSFERNDLEAALAHPLYEVHPRIAQPLRARGIHEDGEASGVHRHVSLRPVRALD